MSDIKYEITEELGVISESPKGWTRELNRVSWNGREAKLDLRDWAPEHANIYNKIPSFIMTVEPEDGGYAVSFYDD